MNEFKFPKSIYITGDSHPNTFIKLNLNKINECDSYMGLCASYGKNEQHTLMAAHMELCYENDPLYKLVRQIRWFSSAEEAIKEAEEACKKEIESLNRILENKKSVLEAGWEVTEEK